MNNSTRPLAFLPRGRISWFVGIEDTCVLPRASDEFGPLDEHELTGHNQHLRSDLEQVAELGVDGLRYGMSWPLVHTAPGRFDWSILDPAIEQLAAQGTHVIADLVHYGCPPWLEDSFVDDRFVDALASFAEALLNRYGPAIGSVTPINEPSTTASFSGLRSVWPPALGSRSGWASVVVNLAAAGQAVTHIVREVSPATAIVHVEAAHHIEATEPQLVDDAEHLTRLADLSTDLLVGEVDEGHPLWAWLAEHGVRPSRLVKLQAGAVAPDVLGINYYPDLTPRALVSGDHGTVTQIAVNRWSAGLSSVLRRAGERYQLPLLLTETSIEGSVAVRIGWLEAVLDEVRELRADAIDVRGVTWWPLIDFIDWSVNAAGRSVEEFVGGVVDPATNELVAVPTPKRDVERGIDSLARRMGLLALAEDEHGSLTRRQTAVADRLKEFAAAPAPSRQRLWDAGPAFKSVGTTISLDGEWTFLTPDGASEIQVPSLWEAEGHLGLDDTATYLRTFGVGDPTGFWTLRFGAVMDEAQVALNGTLLGEHSNPYTPFEMDVSGLLTHSNEVRVRVSDPPVGSAAHQRGAHGKQGWANHEFPSPPSLYLTYGGIWQTVTLRQHGVVAIRDLSCDLDPKRASVTVDLERLVDPHAGYDALQKVLLVVGIADRTCSIEVPLEAGESRSVAVEVDTTGLARWQPNSPAQHECSASVSMADELSDSAAIKVGLRRVGVNGNGLTIDGNPIRVKSALVQGFHAERLYAEGTDADIEAEVRAAQALGFNMLRLHLRPFAPEYLDICDRLGMLLHCDVSIGEPIQHDELDAYGATARQCERALVAQVRRDRSHPAIVLWSCMNEIGNDRKSFRLSPRYEPFVRRMVSALRSVDGTRPFIENDWIEPDPERVFESPALTAHWYGHLDRAYLEQLASECGKSSQLGRPLLVTEFGDWGLPDPDSARGKFFDHVDHYRRELEATSWTGTLRDFSQQTQVYQGVTNRLQIDILRTAGTIAGYCLTELVDVPWEFNGILDINRDLKDAAGRFVLEANRALSPILRLTSFAAVEGTDLSVQGWISNDEDEARTVDVTLRQGGTRLDLGTHTVPPLAVADLGCHEWTMSGPAGPSTVEITAVVRETDMSTTATYPILVHTPTPTLAPTCADLVTVRGTPEQKVGLERFSAETNDIAPGEVVLLVAEGALDQQVAKELRAFVDAGGTGVVLAQPPNRAAMYPFATEIQTIRAEWGGTPFRFTTDDPGIRAFPQRTVLHVHDADIAPEAVIRVPDVAQTAVGVFKPLPRPAHGAVLAAVPSGQGVVVCCQYRLQAAIQQGHHAASVVLEDIVRWALRQRSGEGEGASEGST